MLQLEIHMIIKYKYKNAIGVCLRKCLTQLLRKNNSIYYMIYLDEYVFFMRKEENTFVYEYINKKAKEIFTENPHGKRLEQCFDEFHCKTILYHYNRAFTLKQSVSYQDHHCIKGTTFVNETTAIPIFDEKNMYILATTKKVIKTKEMQDSTYILESYRKGVNDAALVAMTNNRWYYRDGK